MRQAYSVVTPVAVCSVSVSASSAICIGNETEDIFLMLYNSRFEIAWVWLFGLRGTDLRADALQNKNLRHDGEVPV